MMPIPWLHIIDAVIGVTTFARNRRAPDPANDQLQQQQLESAARTPGGLEARMAGVVVAALKEAFDRDSRRLDLEREQLAAERQRAERALRLEMLRQAADREIGRLRLLAGVAVAGWIGTLLLAMLPGGLLRGGMGARVALGVGWLLLGAALAAAFSAQAHVARAVDSLAADDDGRSPTTGLTPGPAATAALWLIVAGLMSVGVAVLIG
jgi:hypothetical protein